MMESATSPHRTIPAKGLKIWKVFSDVGLEGDKILKTAKLAHADKNEGYVVTMEDQTYFFLLDDAGGVKIVRIPELCSIQVKEFVMGLLNLALTEDGRIYSWCREFRSSSDDVTRYREPFDFPPVVVTGSLTGEKVVQVASSGGHVLAVTLGGDVHHWVWRGAPTLIAGEKFDNKEVISVTCNDYMNVALTKHGKLFKWKWGNEPRRSVLSTCSPIKKISASKSTIFALAVDGSMQSVLVSGSPVRGLPFSGYKNVKDVATCVTEDVIVVELNVNTCLGPFVGNRVPWNTPFFVKSTSLDDSFAETCQTSYRTTLVRSELKPRNLLDDISNLWTTKKNADVTFSVEGKLISAHKLILTMRSEYFEKMFSGEWAETDGSIVDIKDTNHDIFEGLIFYIYHDKIPFANFDYENLFGLMKLADSYCDLTIRRECEEILMGSVNKENAFFLLRNAASVNALDLEEKVTKVILDSQFFGETLSPAELVDLLGREAFDKLATAAFYRN